jgi:hypothetical protein
MKKIIELKFNIMQVFMYNVTKNNTTKIIKKLYHYYAK